jgi:transcriptional regulator with XRE-family HTH domain
VIRRSHDDPSYGAALKQMGRRLQNKLNEKDWTQADLVRAAKPFMAIDPGTGTGRRLSADTISNIINGKVRPTARFVVAISKALDCADKDWMPEYLLDSQSQTTFAALSPVPALLTEVPGRADLFRVYMTANCRLTMR